MQLRAWYVENSKRGKIKFQLSNSQFMKLVTQDCFYCGAPPTRVVAKLSGGLVYNGVDRVNPKLGYLVANCVAACKKCNWLKGTLPVDEFLGQVHAIQRHLKTGK